MGIETALAVGGGALLGGLAGSQQQGGGTQTTTSEPWAPQQPYLTYGFDQAKTLYGNASQNPVYQGKRVADFEPQQWSAVINGGNFADNSWKNARNLRNQSNNLLNTGVQFGGNAADLYNQYSDPTGALGLGNTYANSSVASGLIDAASRDVTRNLYENQLPTLAKAAAGSGNTNSTRAGVESAIAQRGAADRLADVSSSIRGQLFNQGNSQYNQNLQNSLAANSQLAGAYNTGMQGLLNSANYGSSLYNLGMGAGTALQNQRQNELNASMQQFNEGRDIPLDLLGRYMGIVQGNYGGTQTAQMPSYGGGWQGALTGALGGALGGAGVGQKLGFMPTNTSNGVMNPISRAWGNAWDQAFS